MSMEIKPLAGLPDADRARQTLERLQREFLPIAKARGYTVTSLSEMCCCGDAGRRGNGRGRGGRPMSNNVWGYNQGHGRGGTCRISIRLRQPTDHGVLLPYENAAGTMAHELAHCVHGNHSAAFYKLMDEIAEQHADYVSRGLVVDRDGFPMGGESHTLGGRGQNAVRNAGNNGGGGGGGGGNLRDAVRRAAEERSKRPAPMQPQKLGRGNVVGGGIGGGIDPKLPPREAARLAAERRALLDSKWCLPCNEIIEILSDDEEEEEEEEGDAINASDAGSDAEKKVAARNDDKATNNDDDDITDLTAASTEKKKRVGDNRKRTTDSDGTTLAVPIDLTESPERPPRKRKPSSATSSAASASAAATDASAEWACTACTLQNRPEALACDACGKARWSNGDEAATAADAAMRRDDAIAAARENEIRRSEDDFGGFNIYGTKKRETGTLPHLT